jgi:phage shock protein C
MSQALVRPRDNRVIAGVAAGIAQRFGWDPTMVRLVMVASILLPGPQFILYLIAWLVMPEEGDPGRRS